MLCDYEFDSLRLVSDCYPWRNAVARNRGYAVNRD